MADTDPYRMAFVGGRKVGKTFAQAVAAILAQNAGELCVTAKRRAPGAPVPHHVIGSHHLGASDSRGLWQMTKTTHAMGKVGFSAKDSALALAAFHRAWGDDNTWRSEMAQENRRKQAIESAEGILRLDMEAAMVLDRMRPGVLSFEITDEGMVPV